jgi:SAM-dependent methyltransferase
MSTKTLDLGCGLKPRNPFNADELFGIDIRPNENQNIKVADLAIEAIPFPDDHFDYVSAYDFIEHIPRVIYNPNRRFSFIELMNEIYRVLKMGGTFASFTPASPKEAAFVDPTHVNIITENTFPLYFDNKNRWGKDYGFIGSFEIVDQKWHPNNSHLQTIMKKVTI